MRVTGTVTLLVFLACVLCGCCSTGCCRSAGCDDNCPTVEHADARVPMPE